jgi:hypothetical protein
MLPILDRLVARLSPRSRDRRNIDALARRLGVSRADAEWIFTRSRVAGFGAAMIEYEERCRERAAEAALNQP